MSKKIKNYDSVINRTIYLYYIDRAKEFKHLLYKYKTCTDLNTRRKLRERKEQLIYILDKAVSINKISLINLGISYVETKKYPKLLEIKRKEQYLKRCVA
jgi:hypothetical protein